MWLWESFKQSSSYIYTPWPLSLTNSLLCLTVRGLSSVGTTSTETVFLSPGFTLFFGSWKFWPVPADACSSPSSLISCHSRRYPASTSITCNAGISDSWLLLNQSYLTLRLCPPAWIISRVTVNLHSLTG